MVAYSWSSASDGYLIMVSSADGGQIGNGASVNGPAAISEDGRYVALTSAATNLVSGDGEGRVDVFVKGLVFGTVIRASETPSGTGGDADSSDARISNDGRFIDFATSATNLFGDVPGQPPGRVMIDLDARGQFEFDERPGSPYPAPGTGLAALPAPGRFQVFASTRDDLVQGDMNGVADVFVLDGLTGHVVRISATADGLQANGASANPILSGNQFVAVYSSEASNLLPGDTNAAGDVFAIDLVKAGIVDDGTVLWTGTGSLGADRMLGTSGLDAFKGLSGADALYGFGGADELFGQGGDDILDGGEGNDRLDGGDGVDLLYGGAGDDVLTGGAGPDRMYGGAGGDTYYVDDANDVVDESPALASQFPELAGDGATDTIHSTAAWFFDWAGTAEILVSDRDGTGGPATLGTRSQAGVAIVGHDGMDILWGWTGNDELFGAKGRDVLFGDAGADMLDGGDGNDVLNGGEGDDQLFGGAGSDDLYAGNGADLLRGGSGADFMYGGDGDDTYWVDHTFDAIDEGTVAAAFGLGGGGYDKVIVEAPWYWVRATGMEEIEMRRPAAGSEITTVIAAGDNNLILGDSGRNYIFAGAGADRVDAGAGIDDIFLDVGYDANGKVLASDADTFVFKPGNEIDIVHDFQSGLDKVDLTAWRGLGPSDFATLLDASDVVEGDTLVFRLGDTGADQIWLRGTTAAELTAADFLF